MQSTSPATYQQKLTEVIQKLMVILGPDITFARLKTIPDLIVLPNGTVEQVITPPSGLIAQLSLAFSDLSPFVVKKTIEQLNTSPFEEHSLQSNTSQ